MSRFSLLPPLKIPPDVFLDPRLARSYHSVRYSAVEGRPETFRDSGPAQGCQISKRAGDASNFRTMRDHHLQRSFSKLRTNEHVQSKTERLNGAMCQQACERASEQANERYYAL